MGIVRVSARLLLDEAKREPFSGSVLQLGKMAVFFRHADLASWADKQGVPLAPVDQVELSHDPRLAAQECLSDDSFFRLLGFDDVVSCDVSDYEGADVLCDLNCPVDESLKGRFDAVFEGGTIQHIFDLRQVFDNIHDLLKPGGRVIHAMSPSNNHVDHGFYMFSPTLFADVYSAFGYRIDAFFLFDFTPFWFEGRFFSRPAAVYAYEPGSLDHLSYGRWGNRQTSIFVAATRLPEASNDVIPQQGYYRKCWTESGDKPAARSHPSGSAERYVKASRPVLAWKYLREKLRRIGPKRRPSTLLRY